ncbi:MAG: hypothetical protein HY847_09345 [Betaproteobacteria bacterium]|nr:hypothetical protein [Betaproteobacteria bacterium]
MKLFDLLKDKLKDPKGVISDKEMCLLNRRDFMFSETSMASNILGMFGAQNVTYEMRAILDFLHAYLCKLDTKADVRVYQLSQTMTLPALMLTALLGDSSHFKVYVPQGSQQVVSRDAFANDLLNRFKGACESSVPFGNVGKGKNSLEIVLCNASNEADVASGLRLFANVKRGLILIKGYGRVEAPNCGELVLGAGLNVFCSLAGFGFAAAV